MNSSLEGVIQELRAGRPLRVEQIDEIERTLNALRAEGWSGLITADRAVRALVAAGEDG